jgi:hypothetical protein
LIVFQHISQNSTLHIQLSSLLPLTISLTCGPHNLIHSLLLLSASTPRPWPHLLLPVHGSQTSLPPLPSRGTTAAYSAATAIDSLPPPSIRCSRRLFVASAAMAHRELQRLRWQQRRRALGLMALVVSWFGKLWRVEVVGNGDRAFLGRGWAELLAAHNLRFITLAIDSPPQPPVLPRHSPQRHLDH